jgi:hypothetical protein
VGAVAGVPCAAPVDEAAGDPGGDPVPDRCGPERAGLELGGIDVRVAEEGGEASRAAWRSSGTVAVRWPS